MNVLRFHGLTSRTAIASETGLNKATVSAIVDELIGQSLISEVGQGPSTRTGGRRPILLSFNADVGYAVGIDIEVDFARLAVTNLSGKMFKSTQCTLIDPRNPESVVSQLLEQIDLLTVGLDGELGLVGIGIGIPAMINSTSGMIIHAPNLAWKHVDLRKMIADATGVLVAIDNEANTAALGEMLQNPHTDPNFIFISMGIGIGVGIVSNGDIVHGAVGMAGEFGHMTVVPGGLLCGCGNRGCWEMYASERALVREYLAITGRKLPGTELFELVKHHDAEACLAFEQLVPFIRLGVENIVKALNPSRVIIGNTMSQLGPMLVNPLASSFTEQDFYEAFCPVQVDVSPLGANSCSIGAASLILHKYFAGPF